MDSANLTYKINIDAEITQMRQAVESTKNQFKQLFDAGQAAELQKELNKVSKQLDDIVTKTSGNASTAGYDAILSRLASIRTESARVVTELADLQKSVDNRTTLLPEGEQQRIKAITRAWQAFVDEQAKAMQKTEELTKAERKLNKIQQEKARFETAEQAATKAQEEAAATIKSYSTAQKAEYETIIKKNEALQQQVELVNRVREAAKSSDDARKAVVIESPIDGSPIQTTISAASRKLHQMEADWSGIGTDKQNSALQYQQLTYTVEQLQTTIAEYRQKLKELTEEETAATAQTNQLSATFKQISSAQITKAFNTLSTDLGKIGVDLGEMPVPETKTDVEQLNNIILQFVESLLGPADEAFNKTKETFNSVGSSATSAAENVRQGKDSFIEENEAAKQVDGFIARIKQYTGLAGAAYVARNAIRSAFNSIKELDVAMTEMAVVTEASVSDYWNQLPQYTKRANELGVTIKSVYESAGLYYQQGLKTNEVTAMTNATLKMARIAGLSAADATDKMTSALRGFNMEINEANAEKVADVYSELAAISASNTKEISSAMTKVASIAKSAGMEFETTAAFLAQGIEATREPAENIGTALKTVVARFQELKKDPAEIGEVDGEVVDANAIETALRSVKIELRDTDGQFRNLDQVLLELSSKWDAIDGNTQRYIATIAAGSRQQSRFLAMINDYSRVMDLVTAANNSAGASSEQYNKTLSSLETKLAKLKNAWNTFTMGLANNELIKLGIDLLTGLLTVVNKLTEGWDSWSGSALKIAAVTLTIVSLTKAVKAFRVAATAQGGTISAGFGAALTWPIQSFKNLALAMTNTITTTASLSQLEKMYANAKKKTTAAIEQAAVAQAANNITLEQQQAAEKAVIDATLEEQQLSQQIVAQKEIINTLTQNGISQTMAETLAVHGLTQAKYEEMVAQEMANGLSKEEATQRVLKTLAINAETQATTLNTLIQKNRLLSLFQTIGWLVMGKNAELADAAAKGTNTLATLAQTVANEGLAASFVALWAAMGPVIIGMAVVAGLIALVVLAWKGFKEAQKDAYDSSAEGQLERTTEALTAASEAAEQAADSYTNLKDSLAGLQEQYETLDGLTRGTQEWNDQLLEVNSTVLDLVGQYKELGDSAYLTNDNGVLRLDLNKSQEVVRSRQMTAMQAQNAKISAQISQIESQERVRWAELSRDAQLGEEYQHYRQQTTEVGVMSSVAQAILPMFGPMFTNLIYGNDFRELRAERDTKSQGFTEQVARQFAENPPLSAEDARKIIKQIDDSRASKSNARKLYENRDELVAYGQEILQNDATKRTLQATIISNAIQALGSTYSSAAAAEIQNFALHGAVQAAEAIVQEQIDDIKDFRKEEDYKKYWQNIYGADTTISKSGEITYYEDGEKKTIGAESAKEQFAGARITESLTTQLKQFPSLLTGLADALKANTKNLSLSQANSIWSRYFSKQEGAGLTRSDVDILKNMDDEDLRSWYATLSEDQQKALGDIDTFITTFRQTYNAIDLTFEQITTNLEKYGLKLDLGNLQLDAEQEKTLSTRLITIANTSGTETAQEINNQINEFLKTSLLSDADKKTFVQQFLALDWSSVSSLEKFQTTLDNLNITVDKNQLSNLIDNIELASNAARDFDLTNIEDQLKSLMTTAQKIMSGEQTRNFDDEVVQKLIKAEVAEADDFIKQLDGTWNYIGDSLNDLEEAIMKNTDALTEDSKQQLQSKVDVGEYLFSTDWINEALSQRSNLSNEQRRADLWGIRDWLSAQFGSEIFDDLGIKEFSENTQISKISDTMVETILDSLAQVINDIGSNKTKLKGLNDLDAFAAIGFGSIVGIVGRALSSDAIASNQLLNRAVNAGVSETVLKRYNQIMATGNAITKEQITIELARRTAQAESETGYRRMITTLGDLNTQYKYAREGSQHYYEMIEKLGEALKLDMTDSNNLEWVQQNLQLIRSAGEGNVEAMVKLQQKLIEISKNPYYVSLEVIQTIAEQTDSWENPYDWLENLNEEINGIIQARTELESRYDATLADTIMDTRTLLQLTDEQIDREKELANEYLRRVDSLMLDITNQEDSAARQGWDKLYHIDGITGSIIVDPAAVERAFAGDSASREQFETFITELKANRDAVRDNTDELYNSLKSNRQRLTTGRDSYITIMNDIKDQLVSLRESAINEMQEISDTVTNQQSALLEEIRNNLSEQREQKELQNSIDDLADKQTRLAYLQLDTSGASDLEILQLQKEIAEDSDSLQENLIDSALDSIESANEAAQKQREEQISIAQEQLEAYQQSPQIWNDAQVIYEQAMRAVQSGMGLEGTTYGQMLKTTLGNILGAESDQKISETLQSLVESSVWTDADVKADILDVIHKLQEALDGYGITERGDSSVKETGTKVSDTDYDLTDSTMSASINRRLAAEQRVSTWFDNQTQATWETAGGDKATAAWLMEHGTLDEQRQILRAMVRGVGRNSIDALGIQGLTAADFANNWANVDSTQMKFIWAELLDILKRTNTPPTYSYTPINPNRWNWDDPFTIKVRDNARNAIDNQPSQQSIASSTTTEIGAIYMTIQGNDDPDATAEAVADRLLGMNGARFLVNSVR